MTDSFEQMQKKTGDLEAKVELLDTQSRRNNPCSSSLGYLVFSGKHGICVKPK